MHKYRISGALHPGFDRADTLSNIRPGSATLEVTSCHERWRAFRSWCSRRFESSLRAEVIFGFTVSLILAIGLSIAFSRSNPATVVTFRQPSIRK